MYGIFLYRIQYTLIDTVLLYKISGKGYIVNQNHRNALIWIGGFLALFALVKVLNVAPAEPIAKSVPYSDFLKDVHAGNIEKVNAQGPEIVYALKNGQTQSTTGPLTEKLITEISEKDATLKFKLQEDSGSSIWAIILSWLPLLILSLPFFFMWRNMQKGGGGAMGFGKSKARLLEKGKKVLFEEVAGIEEAKSDLQEIIDFLKEPQKFQRLGARIPRGVLLVGPPGTGKTLLARAIAGEADVPFFSISGSDFVEMFVGVGASRVRDMFADAKKNSPCIIFIDEIDAVGRHRGSGMGGGNDEREQTLNQLLVEMDGFEENQGVIIVAATNRPDVLDKALLRPGRFDRQVTIPNPDILGREQILKVHMKKTPMNKDVDVNVIARGTPGFSGAELANLVNEAALLAARTGKLSVGMKELDTAKDKVMMGAERKTMAMTDKEKKLTAFHEGGHALVGTMLEDSDPIHKATIIPRGQALGMVMQLPENDRVSMTRAQLIASIKVAMGGRIAEELIFGHDKVTTGASSDIQAATRIARYMIREGGLNGSLGFQNFKNEEEGYSSSKPYSEATSEKIDQEIAQVLETCYKETTNLLKDNLDKLHVLGNALLEFETLTGDEIKQLMDGKELLKPNYSKELYKPNNFIPTTDGK
ncbi:MAG: cell division protein FtsH [Alphaproteobacteria bacterium CG_4_10_14_0_8_um_filter_37_21]|nr:MAG: cell division protein FtsH [Alphaproteobacteria bacterium CG_4_10_14_0_8_um_filter_37_21]